MRPAGARDGASAGQVSTSARAPAPARADRPPLADTVVDAGRVRHLHGCAVRRASASTARSTRSSRDAGKFEALERVTAQPHANVTLHRVGCRARRAGAAHFFVVGRVPESALATAEPMAPLWTDEIATDTLDRFCHRALAARLRQGCRHRGARAEFFEGVQQGSSCAAGARSCRRGQRARCARLAVAWLRQPPRYTLCVPAATCVSSTWR